MYTPKLLVRARLISPVSRERNVTEAPRVMFERVPEYAVPRTSAPSTNWGLNVVVLPCVTSAEERTAKSRVDS